MLQLDAPAYVSVGQSLNMDCQFDLEGKKLYRQVADPQGNVLPAVLYIILYIVRYPLLIYILYYT